MTDHRRTSRIWLPRLAPFLAATLVFLVFSRSLKGEFLNWDDEYNFLLNTAYRGLAWPNLKWMFSTFGMGLYCPLASFSAGFDYVIWGMNPFGYHLTNVLIHCANAAVFYLLCRGLLTAGAQFSGDQAGTALAAGLAAFFFAVHPLRVEPVAWVSGRHDLIMTLFYQLAILCYIASRRAGDDSGAWLRRQAPPLFLFLLSLLSKGAAVTLPLVLILLDIYPLGRLAAAPRLWLVPENRKVLAEKLPYFALSLAFGVVALAGQAKAGSIIPYEKFGFSPRAAQVLYGLAFYPLKTLIPLDLIPFYRLPDGFGVFDRQSLLRAAALVAVTAAAIVARKRLPAAAAAWAYYLLTIWPMAGIVKINEYWAADRYSYIACLGFAALAGAGVLSAVRGGKGPRRNLYLAGISVTLAVFAALTWRQQGFWLNSEALWRHTLSVSPDSWMAHNSLGAALAKRGETAEARKQFVSALSAAPENAMTYYNLGGTFRDEGKRDEAIKYFERALALDPGLRCARLDLAVALAWTGRLGEAEAQAALLNSASRGNAAR